MTWNEKMALEYIEARDLLKGRIKDIKLLLFYKK